MHKILLDQDPPTAPGGVPPAPAPAPEPVPPPAAHAVVHATRTEREIALESDLATERNSHAKTAKDKKEREVRIAELEDELHKLRSGPAPAEKREGFFDISGLFED